MPARKLLSTAQAAERLGVNKRTLNRYRAEGRIRAYRIGPRLVKYDTTDLDAFMQPIPTWGAEQRGA